MSLQETIAKGKAALARKTAPAETVVPASAPRTPPMVAPRQKRQARAFFEPEAEVAVQPLLDPATEWRAALVEKAITQFQAWVEAAPDFVEVRDQLLREFAATSVVQPSTYPEDQAELCLTGKAFPKVQQQDKAYRRQLLRDTLARWVWLQKRGYPMSDYGGPYKHLTMPEAETIASEVIEAEIRRRK